MAVVRQHTYKSLMKCLVLKCDKERILRSIRVLTIECLDPENAEDLSRIGLFNIRNVEEKNNSSTDPIPLTIICSVEPSPLELVLQEEFTEIVYITLVPKGEQFRTMTMPQEDRYKYDLLTKHLGSTMYMEDLDSWSKLWLMENHRTLVDFSDKDDSWSHEAFALLLVFWEYAMPGTSIHLKAKAGTKWSMRAVDEVTKETRSNFYAYRVFVNSHLRSIWEQIDYNNEGSENDVLGERPAPAASPSSPGIDMNFVNGMSKLNAIIMAEKNAISIENINLKESLKIIMAHNRELLSQLHSMMFGEDKTRKDGLQRKVKFGRHAEDSAQLEVEDEELANDTAKRTGRTVDTVSGTTIAMPNDLRLKLIKATITPDGSGCRRGHPGGGPGRG